MSRGALMRILGIGAFAAVLLGHGHAGAWLAVFHHLLRALT